MDCQAPRTKKLKLQHGSENLDIAFTSNSASISDTSVEVETTTADNFSAFHNEMTPSKDGDEICTYCFDIDPEDTSVDVPFNNGEWLPVIPEPEHELFWWSFPWLDNFFPNQCRVPHDTYPYAVWKLVAGRTVTHLPEECINILAPSLACHLFHRPRKAPYTVDFGPKYECVLELFTGTMLGLKEDVPTDKRGLLNNLFDDAGYKYTN